MNELIFKILSIELVTLLLTSIIIMAFVNTKLGFAIFITAAISAFFIIIYGVIVEFIKVKND